jgi:hypothetical protein
MGKQTVGIQVNVNIWLLSPFFSQVSHNCKQVREKSGFTSPSKTELPYAKLDEHIYRLAVLLHTELTRAGKAWVRDELPGSRIYIGTLSTTHVTPYCGMELDGEWRDVISAEYAIQVRDVYRPQNFLQETDSTALLRILGEAFLNRLTSSNEIIIAQEFVSADPNLAG